MSEATRHGIEGLPVDGEIFELRTVDVGIAEGAHPFRGAHDAEIAENWEAEIAANPTLFDGDIVFQRAMKLENGHLASTAHLTGFSTLLYWRRQARPTGGAHLFAMPLILSSDGALVAIRMARHTANPGKVYCAAGSLDASDIVAGRCDLDANMRREVLEETGLDLDHARSEAVYRAVIVDRTVCVTRLFQFASDAETLREAIRSHISGDVDPEIDDAVIIRSGDARRDDYAFFMPPFLEWLAKRQDWKP